MAYFALVTKLKNVHKDENSDRLYLAECFGEGVIVGPDTKEDDLVLYFPTDGKMERWFGDKFNLFRENLDCTKQGGYLENNGHIKAIRLRGNRSSGIVISIARITEVFGDLGLKDGDKIDSINEQRICEKYIPNLHISSHYSGGSKKKKRNKANNVVYPEFAEHIDTAQLAYNANAFRPGDHINLTLKMHGTSQRSMNTYGVLPNNWFRRLFHLKPKTKRMFVLGTRRTTVDINKNLGYYGTEDFRIKHHERLKPFLEEGMEVFCEITGYFGEAENQTIMPIVSTAKVNDKNFAKEYGSKMAFTYGCNPGESDMWIYRITSQNGEKEWTPQEITDWCEKNGFNRVPVIDDFEFTTIEDLRERIDKYFEDLRDPIGKTHIKEGVVARIVNRPHFEAYKDKTFYFKVLEGICKDESSFPDMEEAQEVLIVQ